MSRSTDVLVASLGTTRGLRNSDARLIGGLEQLGYEVAVAGADYSGIGWLRGAVPLTDLVEAAAMRRGVSRALRAIDPALVIYSTTTAALLQPVPRREERVAISIDSPAAQNRPGAENALGRALERLRFRRAGDGPDHGSRPAGEAGRPGARLRTDALAADAD